MSVALNLLLEIMAKKNRMLFYDGVRITRTKSPNLFIIFFVNHETDDKRFNCIKTF